MNKASGGFLKFKNKQRKEKMELLIFGTSPPTGGN